MICTPEAVLTNEAFVFSFLQEILSLNISEFCICPGARNAPIVSLLDRCALAVKYYWFEERSAAFFALGRARLLGKPVAIVTTSGTAAGELLPAMMEAYYTTTPLFAITADRPRRFRGSGAPQTAEQVGIFGRYAIYEEDLQAGENSNIASWTATGPAHVNLCFEEPCKNAHFEKDLIVSEMKSFSLPPYKEIPRSLRQFFSQARFPFIIVGSISQKDVPYVKEFLLRQQVPVYFEATSLLREDDELCHLAIRDGKNFWSESHYCDYPIDSVLRIGGIPTCRFWRDLEDLQDKVSVYSISENPFCGLSSGACFSLPLSKALPKLHNYTFTPLQSPKRWIQSSISYVSHLELLMQKYPYAEQSIFRHLSKIIPEKSFVFLGNSSPIREWDLCATYDDRKYAVSASRGLNGIDGQLSTFFGLCSTERQNWCIVGDLTALYDLSAPWVLNQLFAEDIVIVVVNNGGGQIFSRMFEEKIFLNQHAISFKAVADLWGINYACFHQVPKENFTGRWLIELIPDNCQTKKFWNEL